MSGVCRVKYRADLTLGLREEDPCLDCGAPIHAHEHGSQPITIGHIVHYYSTDEAKPLKPLAAIVSGALDDGAVSLTVFASNAILFVLNPAFSETPKRGCWSWPPIQREKK